MGKLRISVYGSNAATAVSRAAGAIGPVLLVVGLSLAGPAARADTLFGSEVARNEIFTIDPQTGAHVLVGRPGFGIINGLGYDPNHDVLYGISAQTDRVYRIDQESGQATPVGPVGALGFDNANGLAYDALDDVLFGTDNNTNTLFTINVSDSSTTPVGTIGGGFHDVEGLAYDAVTDTLFGVADRENKIIIIDQETGDARGLPATLPEAGNWRGLAFDRQTRQLCATIVIGSRLYSIDPATGAATFIGDTGDPGTAMQGLAFAFQPCPGERVKLAARCGNGTVKATVKRLTPQAEVTLCLDDERCVEAQANDRGKAKARWTDVPPGDHQVQLAACGLVKAVTCR